MLAVVMPIRNVAHLHTLRLIAGSKNYYLYGLDHIIANVHLLLEDDQPPCADVAPTRCDRYGRRAIPNRLVLLQPASKYCIYVTAPFSTQQKVSPPAV
jgi:hypothetical protein